MLCTALIGGEQQREEAAHENQKNRGQIADAEPENGDRNPGQRRNRPKDLHERIERHLRPAVPANAQPKRNREYRAPAQIPRSRGRAKRQHTSAAARAGVVRRCQLATLHGPGRRLPGWRVTASCQAASRRKINATGRSRTDRFNVDSPTALKDKQSQEPRDTSSRLGFRFFTVFCGGDANAAIPAVQPGLAAYRTKMYRASNFRLTASIYYGEMLLRAFRPDLGLTGKQHYRVSCTATRGRS